MHATAIHWPGLGGALILGPSASGKSDLALRTLGLGALLISDDQVILTRKANILIAEAPPPIAGYLEARRIGIIAVPSIAAAALHAAFIIEGGPQTSRLPEPQPLSLPLGATLPSFRIDPLEACAAELVRAGLWLLAHNPDQSLPSLAGFISKPGAS